jgi:hypothetical protein
MFNIGDKVKVVEAHDVWLTQHGLNNDTILTIVDNDEYQRDYINKDEFTVEIDGVKYNESDFQKVSDSYFQGGLIEGKNAGLIGEQCPETIIPVERAENLRLMCNAVGVTLPFQSFHLGAVCNEPPELGVYRPNLEDRKVGKVRVELVDKGFPNALWELAKLMTWAQEAKGYKDHDWKNLPDARNSLPAAASRHRQQHNKGEFYDDESKLYHKVSEAFGVLAELELILTGKIEL